MDEDLSWTTRMDSDTAIVWQNFLMDCLKVGINPNRSEIMRKAFRSELAKLTDNKEYKKKLHRIAELEQREQDYNFSVREGKMEIRQNTFIPTTVNWFKENIINKPISEQRKYRIYQSFLQTALLFKYTKKEFDAALATIGFRVKTVKLSKKMDLTKAKSLG